MRDYEQYEQMDIYEVASIINLAACDNFLYFINEDGEEVPLMMKQASFCKILLQENK